MATVTKVSSQDVGDGEVVHANITLSNSYTRGGEALTGRALGLKVGARVDSVLVAPVGGRAFEWVPDASLPHQGKLKVLGEPGDDFLLNRPSLALGTVSAAEIKNELPFTKSVGGALAEVAAGETAFTATTHDIAADADLIQEAVYLVSVQAGGTVIVTKGVTAGEGLAVPPALPAGEGLVGYVTGQVAAGATDFDATTDDLDAAHLTFTFEDANQEALEGADLSGLTVRATIEGR